MSLRISSAALLLLAAACRPPTAPDETREAPAKRATAPADLADCAINGATQFERACAVERATSADGVLLTIRHPDGGFRRFRVTPDGRATAADGAAPATISSIGDGNIEVAIGDDRYRLPAKTTGAR